MSEMTRVAYVKQREGDDEPEGLVRLEFGEMVFGVAEGQTIITGIKFDDGGFVVPLALARDAPALLDALDGVYRALPSIRGELEYSTGDDVLADAAEALLRKHGRLP
jgi:hypothetical protein